MLSTGKKKIKAKEKKCQEGKSIIIGCYIKLDKCKILGLSGKVAVQIKNIFNTNTNREGKFQNIEMCIVL